MALRKQPLKEILLVDESSFRIAGRHGDALISMLKDSNGVKDNVLTIMTNLNYLHRDPLIRVFNTMLRELNRKGTIMIKVALD